MKINLEKFSKEEKEQFLSLLRKASNGNNFEEIITSRYLFTASLCKSDAFYCIENTIFGGFRIAKYVVKEIDVLDGKKMELLYTAYEYEYNQGTISNCVGKKICRPEDLNIEWFVEKEKAYDALRQKALKAYPIGSKAYFIWNYNEPEIQKATVKNIISNKNACKVELQYIDSLEDSETAIFPIEDYGKTWFTELYKAQEKLERIKDRNKLLRDLEIRNHVKL